MLVIQSSVPSSWTAAAAAAVAAALSSSCSLPCISVLESLDDEGEGPLSLIAKWGAGGTRALFAGFSTPQVTTMNPYLSFAVAARELAPSGSGGGAESLAKKRWRIECANISHDCR